MTRSTPRYLAALVSAAGAMAPMAGDRLAAQECRLPATATVEKNRLSIPVASSAERVTIGIEGLAPATWQRAADNRSLVAEVPIVPDLEPSRAYAVQATIRRAPLPPELEALETESARALSRSASLDTTGLRMALQSGLERPCRRWTLPPLARVTATDAWAGLRVVRDTLQQLRAAAAAAGNALGQALEPSSPWRGAVARLREQAAKPGSATAREIRRLDALTGAEPADTAADRLPGLADTIEQVEDLLATWHARPPDSVEAGAVGELRDRIAPLEEAARSVAQRRSRVPGARADSVRATARLASVMRAQLDAPGTVEDQLAGTVTLAATDEGKLRIGLGLHYTAPLHRPIFGDPGATNRIYPDLFLHWSPAARGERRPVTIDFGLALNTVGRRGETRDLFWRSSLLLGVSVHPRGFIRLGAGVQLVRELTPEGRNKLRIPLYIGASVVQFKL